MHDGDAFVYRDAWPDARGTAELKSAIATDRGKITHHQQTVTQAVKNQQKNNPLEGLGNRVRLTALDPANSGVTPRWDRSPAP